MKTDMLHKVTRRVPNYDGKECTYIRIESNCNCDIGHDHQEIINLKKNEEFIEK